MLEFDFKKFKNINVLCVIIRKINLNRKFNYYLDGTNVRKKKERQVILQNSYIWPIILQMG